MSGEPTTLAPGARVRVSAAAGFWDLAGEIGVLERIETGFAVIRLIRLDYQTRVPAGMVEPA